MTKLLPLLAILWFSSPLLAEEPLAGKWYSASQLELGKKVFKENCMVCHGEQGQGLADNWRKPIADGSYPPPPLNGSAHTWHHRMSTLIRTINEGGVPIGGKMPAFADRLSDEEKIAVIARFQDWWPEEIYKGWIERGGLNH
jgi:mono/diheme cytochrome c family protein